MAKKQSDSCNFLYLMITPIRHDFDVLSNFSANIKVTSVDSVQLESLLFESFYNSNEFKVTVNFKSFKNAYNLFTNT